MLFYYYFKTKLPLQATHFPTPKKWVSCHLPFFDARILSSNMYIWQWHIQQASVSRSPQKKKSYFECAKPPTHSSCLPPSYTWLKIIFFHFADTLSSLFSLFLSIFPPCSLVLQLAISTFMEKSRRIVQPFTSKNPFLARLNP